MLAAQTLIEELVLLPFQINAELEGIPKIPGQRERTRHTAFPHIFKVGRSSLEPSVHKVKQRIALQNSNPSRGGKKTQSSPVRLEATEEPLGMNARGGIVVDFQGEIVLVSVCQCVCLPWECLGGGRVSGRMQQGQKNYKIHQSDCRVSTGCRKLRLESSESASVGQSLSHSFLVN